VSPPLTGSQLRYLRALGHSKKPVVQIGHGGLSASVLSAIDQALETHELVKIRVSSESPSEISELCAAIEKGTRSLIAQSIGRTLLVYRRRKKDPSIVLPKPGSRRQREE
jgi:RNA-binding protein